jgi:hypothetical protein
MSDGRIIYRPVYINRHMVPVIIARVAASRCVERPGVLTYFG